MEARQEGRIDVNFVVGLCNSVKLVVAVTHYCVRAHSESNLQIRSILHLQRKMIPLLSQHLDEIDWCGNFQRAGKAKMNNVQFHINFLIDCCFSTMLELR